MEGLRELLSSVDEETNADIEKNPGKDDDQIDHSQALISQSCFWSRVKSLMSDISGRLTPISNNQNAKTTLVFASQLVTPQMDTNINKISSKSPTSSTTDKTQSSITLSNVESAFDLDPEAKLAFIRRALGGQDETDTRVPKNASLLSVLIF